MKTTLTTKQREVLDFIVQTIRVTLYPPTIREISSNFKWSSTNAAMDYIIALEKKGYLQRNGVGKSNNLMMSIETRNEYGLWFVANPRKEKVK